MAMLALLLIAAAHSSEATAAPRHQSEVWTRAQEDAWHAEHGYEREVVISPLPEDYIKTEDLPKSFSWADKDGVSYVTKSLNQHIPQYCGSCWAHGAISALGDRIKIARKAKGIDVNLAVQHVLNCGTAGSCHGGSGAGVYSWIADISKKTGSGVTYDTCNPYMACSSESSEGFCGAVPDGSWDCKAENVCRTCSTFTSSGGVCSEVDKYPNATVVEHGDVQGADAMAKEIMARG
jgi:cathepsin X